MMKSKRVCLQAPTKTILYNSRKNKHYKMGKAVFEIILILILISCILLYIGLMLLQFIAMGIHRLLTLEHFVASTPLLKPLAKEWKDLSKEKLRGKHNNVYITEA